MEKCPSNNFPMFMFSDLIKSTVDSVDHIGVVPWALLLWVAWLILHSIYRKCFDGLLVKIGVQEPQRQRLIQIYWRLGFACVSIPFALQNVPFGDKNLRQEPLRTLEELPGALLIGEPPTFHTKFSYVLLTGFFLNSVCETCLEHGMRSFEFFWQESLTIFFVCTFPLRSVYFGIAVIATVNVEKCFFEVSRMLCCLSTISRSKMLWKASSGILVLHTFTWSSIYFYVLPKYFLILPLNKLEGGGDTSHVSLLLLLTLSIWLFYCIELCTSPLGKFLIDQLYGNHRALEKLLFGASDYSEEDFIIENHMNHSIERTMNSSQSKAAVPQRRPKIISDHRKNRENLKMMYQTIKCVIRIRRKLKKIRAQKAKETYYDALPFTEETPAHKLN